MPKLARIALAASPLLTVLALGCGPRSSNAPAPVAPAHAARPARAAPIVPAKPAAPGAIDVAISDGGAYAVTDASTGWTFAGDLGRPVRNRRATTGTDALGRFAATTVVADDDAGPMTIEVRAYAGRRVALFSWTAATARASAPAPFPSLSVPDGLHTFSYIDTAFAPGDFHGHSGSTPWLLFDDDGRAAILSPAANFITADMGRAEDGGIASGLNATLADLPAGFTHRSVLAFGDSIAGVYDAWGHALTDLAGKHRPANDADVGLAKLGYWTNTGASYYYNFDPSKGYAGTVKEAVDSLRHQGEPLSYAELDSWWYQKSTTTQLGAAGLAVKSTKYAPASWNCYGGLMDYTASPDLFPDGLAAWQRTLGLPLMVHARWVDVNSPYRDRYRITGLAATDPKYWEDRADYLRSAGVVLFEQDWLRDIYGDSPRLASTTWAGDAFTDNMARACRERGLSVQYCMATPRFYLQGSKYDNLTTVRVSSDRFGRVEWEHALYTSQLATALGEWPFVDNFRSYETPNLILAVLSAGMVGLGDGVGEADVANVARAARPDGVLVKPDTAIVPLDRTYLSDATIEQPEPMVAAAYTDHGSGAHRLRTAYVFTFPRDRRKQPDIEFAPAELGIDGDAWVYEPATDIGRLVAAGEAFTDAFVDWRDQWASYVVAPVAGGGVALLGDAGKIASMGRQRIASAEATATGVRATVSFAAGERAVTLHGFAGAAPLVTASGGAVGPVGFDVRTHRFTVDVACPGAPAEVTVAISGTNR
jgi:hypothetical protein